jgi:hypothetical protein
MVNRRTSFNCGCQMSQTPTASDDVFAGVWSAFWNRGKPLLF